jgi:phosphoglycerate dehydrogenase-like enzyme
MLAAARCFTEHIKATTWRATYAQLGQPERRLKGSTVLIVGTGGIGTALVDMLEPLETRILGINRSGRPLAGAERTGKTEDLGTFLPEADYVVIAAALTDETRDLIDKAAFAAMKPGAWLINVARGGLVDTDAMVEALQSGRLGGAGLDVTEPEPLPDDHPLWDFDNVIITPHVANTADMAIPELREVVRRNVEHFAKGDGLEGLVDVSLGY